jgi:hypothetical protein
VPVTSAEFTQNAPPLTSDEQDTVVDGLGSMLDPFFPYAKIQIPSVTAQRYVLPQSKSSLNAYMMLLRLLIDLDAFGDSTAALAVQNALNTIELTLPTGRAQAGSYCKSIASQWIARLDQQALAGTDDGDAPQDKLRKLLPNTLAWTIKDIQSVAVRSALKSLIAERTASFVAGERRYEVPGRQYRVRAFVRLRSEDGCPPKIIWTEEYSKPFTIAAWYDDGGSDAPPVQVPLPNLFDPEEREAIKKLKPNVAFRVPEKLFDFLQSNDLDVLFDGNKPSGGAGLALDWICGFNIPIITLCAFIVLSIFLSLLNFIFQWLLFVKICIPIPKR